MGRRAAMPQVALHPNFLPRSQPSTIYTLLELPRRIERFQAILMPTAKVLWLHTKTTGMVNKLFSVTPRSERRAEPTLLGRVQSSLLSTLLPRLFKPSAITCAFLPSPLCDLGDLLLIFHGLLLSVHLAFFSALLAAFILALAFEALGRSLRIALRVRARRRRTF